MQLAQQVVQRGFPLQAADDVAQPRQHHLRADVLKPMHATKEADRRVLGRAAAHAQHLHRVTHTTAVDDADGAAVQRRAGLLGQTGYLFELIEHGLAAAARRSSGGGVDRRRHRLRWRWRW